MAQTTFWERLDKTVERQNSLLCVGIDPEDCNYHKIADLVNATSKYACCYKLNLGFFLGNEWELKKIIESIYYYVKLPVIIDGKFGDIENTAKKYANWAFNDIYADAVTLNPYLGEDSIKVFADYHKNGSFILTTTTNPSAGYLQNVLDESTNRWLTVSDKAAIVADKFKQGCVVGNNHDRIRRFAPDSWFLCPGVGAQNGSLEEIMKAQWSNGKGVIISASRSITESEDPGKAAMELRDKINGLRKSV